MNFEKINIYLVIPEHGVRRILADILRNLGFVNIIQGSTYNDVITSIEGNPIRAWFLRSPLSIILAAFSLVIKKGILNLF